MNNIDLPCSYISQLQLLGGLNENVIFSVGLKVILPIEIQLKSSSIPGGFEPSFDLL